MVIIVLQLGYMGIFYQFFCWKVNIQWFPPIRAIWAFFTNFFVEKSTYNDFPLFVPLTSESCSDYTNTYIES